MLNHQKERRFSNNMDRTFRTEDQHSQTFLPASVANISSFIRLRPLDVGYRPLSTPKSLTDIGESLRIFYRRQEGYRLFFIRMQYVKM
jgi:hypothetical protein